MVWGAMEFDFYDCFEVVGIKTMTKPQVLKLVATGRMDVRPSCWDFKKIADHLRTETYKDEYIGEFMTTDEMKKCPGDVLVTNGKGPRMWDVRLLAKHLRFKPAVVKGIQERLKDFDPNSIVVHLRGTDRPDAEGNYTEKAIEAVKKTGIHPNQVFVVTDQRELWERFSAGFPGARLANPNSNILKLASTNKRGSHQQEPSDLKKWGVKKWDMMVDLLADWTALVSCATAVGRSESTYFSMARSIHHIQDDGWKEMFGGWSPFSKTLQEHNETLLLSHREQTEIQQSTGEHVPTAQSVC